MHVCLRNTITQKRIKLPLHHSLVQTHFLAPALRYFSTRYIRKKKKENEQNHFKRTTNIVEILQRIRPQVFLDDICHLCNGGYQRTSSSGTCYVFLIFLGLDLNGRTWKLIYLIHLTMSKTFILCTIEPSEEAAK